jgi:outer membrane protein OmpA-like peptidoglycan-associated protein
MIRKLMAGLAALMFVASCTTTDPVTGERTRNNTGTNAIIGAGIGAALGTLAGGDDRRNAVIGAGIGALGGAAVGQYMDRQEQNLRERLANSGVGITRVNQSQILLNFPADLTFDFDRADVKGQFVPTLRNVAGVLAEYPQTTVDVYGHADAQGADAYNQQLSERRALAVSSVLVNGGVIRERLVATGFGETQPIADNSSEAGRARNRRVEVRISAFQG